MRVWMVNRGVWEPGWWLGPTVSVAHGEADVDEYVATFGELLDQLTDARSRSDPWPQVAGRQFAAGPGRPLRE